MSPVKLRILSVGLLGVLSSVHTVRAATNLISGTIRTNATWSGTNLLQGAVVVTNGAVVTVAPGARLLMSTGAALVVYGQLLADGTSNQPITFTRSTTTTNWARIKFVGAADSRLRHCVVEYANSVGDHQDYYPTNCSTGLGLSPRPYHEAVVALGTRLDIEGCVFQNLPYNTGARDGDAIAIISDDPQSPGTASANIRNCQFLSIGQGIHTRYSYVLVENCLFTDKHGDNDDVDLYGESTPPPLIRNNIFLSGHEDKINPTRCSAIIVGNIITGSDDHGVVLRDRCSPVVMNNLIYNCANACIAVQNQCDALIANNTIVNSLRGIRFFDHDLRWGPPYCLFPGSGTATIINCIIWDCTTSLELADSPYPQDRGSHARVYHCNIEGGQATASVSANSTLLWGAGNLNVDPQFVGLSTNNYRLRVTSPCVDAGTNVSVIATNFSVMVTNDFDGLARPLDGNGDGVARPDIGAHEYLLAAADSNGDGIPDGWVQGYGLNPTAPDVAAGNPDQDPYTTYEEWVADTNPTNALSWFHIAEVRSGAMTGVTFPSSANRQYTLFYTTNFAGSNGMNTVWTNLPGQTGISGNGGMATLNDPNGAAQKFYRVGVAVP